MAKRKTKQTAASVRDAGKTRFELRFDDEIFEAVKRISEENGISVNQFMSGIARRAVQRAIPGEPVRDEQGVVTSKKQIGCLFFGVKGCYYTDEERREAYQRDGENLGQCFTGTVDFALDFTERSVVKDGDE